MTDSDTPKEIPKYEPKRRESSPGVIARHPQKNLIIALLIFSGLLAFIGILMLFSELVRKHLAKKYSVMVK
jgi:hypothetical protein